MYILSSGDSKCPVDGCKILSVELQCFCKNKNRGCKWSGQLADLEVCYLKFHFKHIYMRTAICYTWFILALVIMHLVLTII